MFFSRTRTQPAGCALRSPSLVGGPRVLEDVSCGGKEKDGSENVIRMQDLIDR